MSMPNELGDTLEAVLKLIKIRNSASATDIAAIFNTQPHLMVSGLQVLLDKGYVYRTVPSDTPYVRFDEAFALSMTGRDNAYDLPPQHHRHRPVGTRVHQVILSRHHHYLENAAINASKLAINAMILSVSMSSTHLTPSRGCCLPSHRDIITAKGGDHRGNHPSRNNRRYP